MNFDLTQERTALYFQYLDFSDNLVTQKSLEQKIGDQE